jgi:hypothetical protein
LQGWEESKNGDVLKGGALEKAKLSPNSGEVALLSYPAVEILCRLLCILMG